MDAPVSRRRGGVWKEANSRYLYVSPVNLRVSPPCSSILVSLVILSLPNLFSLFLSFFSPFLSIHSPLISLTYLLPHPSLFSFHIFLATSSPVSLSLVVFDDIRSSLFYNVSSLSIVSFTRIHTRSFHSPFSLYSGHSKTNCHSIRPLFEAWRKFPTAFPVKPPPHPRTNRRGFPPLGTSDLPSLSLDWSTSRWTNRDNWRGKRLFQDSKESILPECFSCKLFLFFFFFECFDDTTRMRILGEE